MQHANSRQCAESICYQIESRASARPAPSKQSLVECQTGISTGIEMSCQRHRENAPRYRNRPHISSRPHHHLSQRTIKVLDGNTHRQHADLSRPSQPDTPPPHHTNMIGHVQGRFLSAITACTTTMLTTHHHHHQHLGIMMEVTPSHTSKDD